MHFVSKHFTFLQSVSFKCLIIKSIQWTFPDREDETKLNGNSLYHNNKLYASIHTHTHTSGVK